MMENFPVHPLPPDLPHVAYVVLWYPLFTQPFIFREVECLRKILPLKVYTLYGPNLRHCSEEMKQALPSAAYGMRKLPSVCSRIGKEIVTNPARFGRLLRRSCFYRWPGLETFGENLWGYCVGLSLGSAFQRDGIDFVYAPWPRGAATAAWVGASIAGLPFATSARGDNLAPADPDLAAKLAAASFIRANNAADQQRIEKFGNGKAKNKTRLVYNSLSLPAMPSKTPHTRFQSRPFRLLALGRFDVTKGFDVLLKAASILKDRDFNFRLTIAGGGGKVMGLGDMDKTLRDLRKALNLEREVSMPGLISHDELPEIIAAHDVFVAPCVVHSSGRRDGIPNTVIEAMAFGIPVISTNVNALPEIVRDGHTGLTVEPGDPAALAEAIIQLCENPEAALRLGKNGAKLAAEIFDPVANARKLANIFIAEYRAWKEQHKGGAPCAE